MVKFQRGDIVQLDWGDAWSSAGWKDAPYDRENMQPIMVTYFGVFLRQDKNGVMIAAGLDEQGRINGPHFVPKGMVKSLKLIVPKKKVKLSY